MMNDSRRFNEDRMLVAIVLIYTKILDTLFYPPLILSSCIALKNKYFDRIIAIAPQRAMLAKAERKLAPSFKMRLAGLYNSDEKGKNSAAT